MDPDFEYVVQGNYGVHGWEDVDTHDSWKPPRPRARTTTRTSPASCTV